MIGYYCEAQSSFHAELFDTHNDDFIKIFGSDPVSFPQCASKCENTRFFSTVVREAKLLIFSSWKWCHVVGANICKSVTWSAVPDAPVLVCEDETMKGTAPEGLMTYNITWGNFLQLSVCLKTWFVDQWPWFEVWDTRVGVLGTLFEAWAEESNLCLGGGDLDKRRFEKLILGAKILGLGGLI